mmetsp:Transcript_5923/g.6599  ORF Transcript_5923/g.6599 Transcript_5923/m.6599 type:complete len:232 (-) Transcript_5923:362-1057(-)
MILQTKHIISYIITISIATFHSSLHGSVVSSFTIQSSSTSPATRCFKSSTILSSSTSTGSTRRITTKIHLSNNSNCDDEHEHDAMKQDNNMSNSNENFADANDGSNDDNDNDNDNADDEDYQFLRDFEKAKIQKLGAPIPKEQAEKSAIEAENEFLNAMNQVKQEFSDIKEEIGLDGAIDIMKKKWDAYDRLQEVELKRQEMVQDYNDEKDMEDDEHYEDGIILDENDSFQ